MNMREKIARAITLADERNGAAPYEYRIIQSKYAKEQLFDEADAVLDALMEPTEGMQEMGDHAYNLTGMSGASGFPANSEEHTTFIWQAMIQAAKEGK